MKAWPLAPKLPLHRCHTFLTMSTGVPQGAYLLSYTDGKLHYCNLLRLCFIQVGDPENSFCKAASSLKRWITAYCYTHWYNTTLLVLVGIIFFLPMDSWQDGGCVSSHFPHFTTTIERIALQFFFQGYLLACAATQCTQLCVRFCLIMLWLILHGSSYFSINVFLLACISLWPIS